MLKHGACLDIRYVIPLSIQNPEPVFQMKALLDGQKMQNERKNVTFYMLAFTKDIIFG